MNAHDRMSGVYEKRAGEIIREELPGLLRIIGQRSSSRFPKYAFRYSYLPRLIDDEELSLLAGKHRKRLRKAHAQLYWKNVELLARDIRKSIRERRDMMQFMRSYDYMAMLREDVRVTGLLASLRFAGFMHACGTQIGLDRARRACQEIEALFSACAVPHLSAEAI